MVLVLYEMQSVSSKIWTRDTVSISYDDNHYITGTYRNIIIIIIIIRSFLANFFHHWSLRNIQFSQVS